MSEVTVRVISIFCLWLIFLTSSIFVFKEHELSFRKKYRLIFLSLFIIAVFQCITPIGLDKPNYIVLYNSINFDLEEYINSIETIIYSKFEPFFMVEIILLKSVKAGYQLFIFLNYFIPFFVIYKYILKKEDNPVLLLCLFITMNYFNMDMIRSFFSASIYLMVLYGIPSVKKYFLSFVIPLFHSVGIIGIAANIITEYKNRKTGIILCAIAICMILLVLVFRQRILAEVIFITSNREYNFFTKAVYYLYNENFINNSTKLTYFVVYTRKRMEFIINIIFLVLAYRSKSIELEHIKIFRSAVLGSFIYIIFSLLGAEALGSRVSQFLSIGMFIIVCDYIKAEKNKKKRGLKYLIIMILILSFNFFITLEYAGIDNPNSPFYLG